MSIEQGGKAETDVNREVDVLMTAECLHPEHPLDFRHLLFLFLFVFVHVTQQLLKHNIASHIIVHLLEMLFYYRNKLVFPHFYHLARKQCFSKSSLRSFLPSFCRTICSTRKVTCPTVFVTMVKS